MNAPLTKEQQGEMLICDPTGHTRTIWDADKGVEVDSARATFDAHIKKGYKAFYVKKDGETGDRMKEFDAKAEKMILIPAIQGG